MYKKFLVIFFITALFTGSCGSISTLPVTQVPTEILTTPLSLVIPSPLPLPTETLTPFITREVVVEPTSTSIFVTPLGARVPVAPGAYDIYYDYFPSMTGESGNSVYYQIAADQSDIQTFYMEELVNAGWTWVYTEFGESLVITSPAPALMMEFRKGEETLGIAASGFGAGASIVFAAVDYSGYSQMTGFISGIAGGLDLMGPYEDDARSDVMQFSSIFLGFKHPSNWLATNSLMQIFESDGNVNFISDARDCGIEMEICFVNFADLAGSHFDIPVSIRTHPEMAGLTLEEANTLHWENLSSSNHAKRYAIPEDLTLPGSLETIEVRNITLGDGTPAMQRIYKWKHEDETDSIISTYTLFLSEDLLLEFHTDFTSEEWKNEQSTVDQVIEGIRIVR